MTLQECFNAMQEPYKSAAYKAVYNKVPLNTEVGKVSDGVLIVKKCIIRTRVWNKYYSELLKMGL